MLITYLQVAGLIAYLVGLSTILGAALASYLGDGVPARAKWASAPVLGLAFAICLFVTTIWVVPGNTGAFLLLPVVPGMAFWAWKRREHLRGRRSIVSAAELGSIIALVFVVFAFPLAYQESLGPGAFQVYDGPNYTANQLGLQTHTVDDPTWGPDWDLTARSGEHNGPNSIQQIGFMAVAATVDAAIGIEPVRTQVPFMIAMVLIGALGAYAMLTTLAPQWRPAAWLGALLFAGPVMYQLVLDGSESAIAGLAFMLPAVMVGALLFRPGPRRALLVLFALIASALQAAYPILAPGFGVAAVVSLLGFVIWQRVVKRDVVPLPKVLGASVVVAVLAMAMAPFAFARNLDYWADLLKGETIVGLPIFDLPLPVLPGWLLGTREFYYLPHLSDVNVTQWLLADVFPLGLLALAAVAIVGRRSLMPLVVLGVITVIVAIGVSASDCSYCVQRGLLPMGPILGSFVAAGIGIVASARFAGAKPVGVVLLLGTLGLAWHTNGVLLKRGAKGAYFEPTAVHDLMDDLKSQPGPVLLEGWGQSYDAPGEMQAAVFSARGGTDVRLSVPTETDDFSGLAYLQGARPSGPVFTPDYKTVVTRLGNVETDREVIKRVGSLALQRRVKPFDVTSVSGTLLNRIGQGRQDVFVANPLSFRLSGPTGPPPAVEVFIRGIRRASLGDLQPGSRVRRVRGGLKICTPFVGEGQIRDTVIPVVPPTVNLVSPGWWANKPIANGGPTLESMHVIPDCDA